MIPINLINTKWHSHGFITVNKQVIILQDRENLIINFRPLAHL